MSSTNTHVLGDVASFVRGITFTPEDLKQPFEEGTAVCMRTKNVQADLDQADLIAVPKEFVRRKEQYLKEGDLLISSANSWNLVGKCCWVPKLDYEATAGGFISILRADRKIVDPRYLYHWFAASRTQHEVRLCGRQTTNISNLNYERCLSLPFPLLKLEEQKRIATVLDKADAVRRKRQEALEAVDNLSTSVFIDEIGDPIVNSRGHQTAMMDEVFAIQTGKLNANSAKPGGRYPFFTCSREDFQIDTYAFDCEALILSGNNASADYSVKHFKGKFNAYQRTYVLILKQPEHSYEYFRQLLEYKLNEMKQGSRGTNTKYLTLQFFQRLSMPVPDPSVQKRYENVSRRIKALKDLQISSQNESDTLFNSLVQRAFKGEL